MNEFNFNLCRVLAHTLVFEKQEEERALGFPAGYFRNDTPSPPPTQISSCLAISLICFSDMPIASAAFFMSPACIAFWASPSLLASC